MAGKKRSRKRPKRSLESSEKSDPVKNVTETSAYVEEKKPKLNDELEKGDKQLSVDKQEPNLATVDSTNNDSVGDLQTEESKYVPPFSRKRRVLKRSGAPPSPAARPKRSLRGVQQNLEQAQPAECPADIDDKQSDVCIKDPKDSPKIEKEERKEEEEEEVDVVGVQEGEDFLAFSAGETTAGNVTEAKDEVVLPLPPTSVWKDTLTIVTQVLENVVNAVCKMVQCNSDETMQESEKDDNKTVEVREIHAEQLNNRSHSLGNEINKCGKEAIAAAKEVLDPSMDAVNETTSGCSTKTAATGEIDSLMKNVAFDDGSKLAKTKSVDSSASLVVATQDTVRLESPLKECVAEDIDSAVMTLQRCNKAENLYSSEEVDKHHGKESCSVNVPCDLSYVQEREDKPQDSETENSAVTSPSVKSAILSSDIITLLEEEIHSINATTVASVDTELGSLGLSTDHKLLPGKKKKTAELTSEQTEIGNKKNVVTLMSEEDLSGEFCDKTVTDLCQINRHSGVEEENHMNSQSYSLLKMAGMTADHTEMSREDYVGTVISEVPGPNVGESDNAPKDLCHLKHQCVDQMVPANHEPTTILSQGNPDQIELARQPNQDELEEWSSKGADKCFRTSHLFEDKTENQANNVEETQTQPSSPKTALSRPIRELEDSHQEEPKSLGTAHTEIYTYQESSSVSRQIKMDQACTQSSVQGSSTTCKQIILGVTEPQLNKPVKVENNLVLQSSELAQGCCSPFSTDGDILEFDCLMDCTDSQLVDLDSSADQPPHQNLGTRQVNGNKGAEPTTSAADQRSVEVPSDNGMIKGLISELSTLNKFIMGVWKDLENQKKQRQARIKSQKGKKLK